MLTSDLLNTAASTDSCWGWEEDNKKEEEKKWEMWKETRKI
jgi:hypothetical protein